MRPLDARGCKQEAVVASWKPILAGHQPLYCCSRIAQACECFVDYRQASDAPLCVAFFNFRVYRVARDATQPQQKERAPASRSHLLLLTLAIDGMNSYVPPLGQQAATGIESAAEAWPNRRKLDDAQLDLVISSWQR